MNIIDTYKKCVGCGACVDVCPTNALKLHHNEDGFYVPYFENDDCVNCEKCLRVCPALNNRSASRSRSCYYGWHNDDIIRSKSSSGGAFTVLAERIISEGGVVLGAMYAGDNKSVVMASTAECDLESLRRSKYCQSFSNGMYAKVAEFLKSGKRVMMVGTPCQIAAARRIFENHQNLLLVDFLCGGVTPETALSNYITYLEKKQGSKVVGINMRDKASGWSKSRIRIDFENGKTYSSRYQLDPYYHYYNTPYMKNESCVTCEFTSHPDADITIADFWGYEKAKVPNDDKGISLMCAYTQQGHKYLELAKKQMVMYRLDDRYVEYAYREKSHSKENLAERMLFLKMMRQTSFIEAAKKHHFKYGRFGVLLNIVKRKVVRK